MERRSYIFSFERLGAFRKFVTVPQLVLLLFCASVALFPYFTFDRISAPLVVGIELCLAAAGVIGNRRYRKIFLLFLVFFFLFFVAGEIYIRLRYFGLKGLNITEYEPSAFRHPLSNFKIDPETYTGLRPGSQAIFKGASVSVNQAGFRGRSYPYEKKKDTVRIVMTGASATFGSGVGDDSTYPALLEELLTSSVKGKRVEVINLGIPNDSIGNMIHVIRTVGLRYDPDIIMILANKSRFKGMPIEIARNTKVKEPPSPRFKIFLNSNYRYFGNQFFIAKLITEQRDGNLDKPALLAFSRSSSYFRTLRKRCKESPPSGGDDDFMEMAGEVPALEASVTELESLTRAHIVCFYLFRAIDKRYMDEPERRYRNYLEYVAGRHGIEVIDGYDVDLTGYGRDELYIYPGDNHPSGIVHRLWAERLFVSLLEMINRAHP